MNRRAVANKPRPGRALRNVVVLSAGERLDFVGARFNGGGFAVGSASG